MTDELSLSIVRHPFRRDLREDSRLPCILGESLQDLFDRSEIPVDVPVLAYVQGTLIPRDKWSVTFPGPGDYVSFIAALQGGGDGKGIFRMVLMLAISVASMAFAPGLATFLPGILYASTLGISLVAGGMMLIGGLLVNALLPSSATSTPTADAATSDSQAYSWAPTNTETQGIPVARWYGKHKVYGNIIGSYIENQGKTQVMNALVCLGMGPIHSLANFKINDQPVQNFKEVTIIQRLGWVNQSVIPNFNDTKTEYTASVEVLYGTPYIYLTDGNDFDALEVDIAFPSGLWSTDSSSSDLQGASVGVRIEARKVGAANWDYVTLQPPDYNNCVFKKFSNRSNPNHLAPRWSEGRRVKITTPIEIGAGSDTGGYTDYITERYWWDYSAGSSVYTDHEEGDVTGTTGYKWHWCGPVPAEYRDGDDDANMVEKVVQLAPGAENSSVTISGATANALYYTYDYDVPEGEKGQYQVRITRLTANANSTTVGDKLYFSGVREVQTDNFRYPRHALVSVRAVASDQLSGSLRFSCVGKLAIVQVWDGTTHVGAANVVTSGSSTTITTTGNAFAAVVEGDQIIANGQYRHVTVKTSDNQVTVHSAVDWDNGAAGYTFQWRHFDLEWSNNPAWVAYDVFTQPVISGKGTVDLPYAAARFDGIDPSCMDIVKFKEWADYCDELVPDGAGGTERRITFNGGFDYDTTMWEAGLKVCQVGRATPVWNGVHLTLAIDMPATPVNLYTVGNIEESKFKETFLPMEERATQIDIDYINKDSGYERDKLTVYRPDVAGNNYKTSIDLFGVTKASEVWRAGMYRLNCNRYIIRAAEIDVDIEALNAQLGDVVYIQHDVPRWGEGGRVVSATAGTVTVDKTVTIELGLAYKLLLRTVEDVIYERTPLNRLGDTILVLKSTNMLTYSEAAANAAWTIKGAISIASDTTLLTDPAGGYTSELIVETATTAIHCHGRTITIVAGGTYTVSRYLQYGGRQYAALYLDDSGANGFFATFDILNGLVSADVAAHGTATAVDCGIDDLGEDWYRCWISGIVSAGATTARHNLVFSETADAGWYPSYLGNISRGVYAWGAQMEAGAAPTPYTLTTTAALPGEEFDLSAEFDEDVVYHVNDTARYDGKIYECIQETTVPSELPTNTSFWTLTTLCPIPVQYDIYAFGQVETVARQFRISDISKSQDQKVTLSLAEYRPEVYEYEEIEPPVNDFTQSVLKMMEPEDVLLSQWNITGIGGRLLPTIHVEFTACDEATYLQSEIWYAKTTANSDRSKWEWLYGGTTSGASYDITGALEFGQTYGIILIPVDTSKNKLYHGRATLYTITLATPTAASQIYYSDVSGVANLHTSGSSTTVTTSGDAFGTIRPGDTIIANNLSRVVATVVDANTITVTEAVNWDNGGTGYAYTAPAPLSSLIPAEPSATRGAVVGDTLYLDDGETVVNMGDLFLDGLWAKEITLTSTGVFRSSDSFPRWEGKQDYLAGFSDANTKQFYISAADGKAYFGGGDIIQDSDGLSIMFSTAEGPNVIQFVNKDGIDIGAFITVKQSNVIANAPVVAQMYSYSDDDDYGSVVSLVANCPSKTAQVSLTASTDLTNAFLIVDGLAEMISLCADDTVATGKLTVNASMAGSRTLDVTGSWGGTGTAYSTTSGNVTVPDACLAYHLVANGSGITPIFTLTGVPDIDGTFFFLTLRLAGGATSIRVRINGVDIITCTTAAFTNYVCYRNNGTWRVVD